MTRSRRPRPARSTSVQRARGNVSTSTYVYVVTATPTDELEPETSVLRAYRREASADKYRAKLLKQGVEDTLKVTMMSESRARDYVGRINP